MISPLELAPEDAAAIQRDLGCERAAGVGELDEGLEPAVADEENHPRQLAEAAEDAVHDVHSHRVDRVEESHEEHVRGQRGPPAAAARVSRLRCVVAGLRRERVRRPAHAVLVRGALIDPVGV